MARVYKIVEESVWLDAAQEGVFHGAAIDHQDGFIHLSAADQVAETAARHFAGKDGLLLAAYESETLGSALIWETSRGGALFPHLYAPLQVAEAVFVLPMPLGADGRHILPALDA
jgi:uncharacterized protein (DUF952 family)